MRILSSKDTATVGRLRALFPAKDNEHEDWQFSKIHKIILGLDSGDLRSEVAQFPGTVNSLDSIGMSPLLWAARMGDDATLDLLLKANADSNLVNIQGDTALCEAVRSGSAVCIKLLLAANAAVLHNGALGYTALHLAAEHGASKDIIQLLVEAGADVNIRNQFGASPLTTTTFMDNLIIATILLDLGADVNLQDYDGDTPLCEALLRHADKVTQLLLQRGASYTLIASNGDSILHLAAKSGGTATLEILIAAQLKGIDPYMQNRDGKTATIIAQERSPTPPGFLPKMYELIMDIDTRNIRLARIPKQETRTPTASGVGMSRAITRFWDFASTSIRGGLDGAVLYSQFARNAAHELPHQVRGMTQSRLQRHPFTVLFVGFVGWTIGIITAVVIMSRMPASPIKSESSQMES